MQTPQTLPAALIVGVPIASPAPSLRIPSWSRLSPRRSSTASWNSSPDKTPESRRPVSRLRRSASSASLCGSAPGSAIPLSVGSSAKGSALCSSTLGLTVSTDSSMPAADVSSSAIWARTSSSNSSSDRSPWSRRRLRRLTTSSRFGSTARYLAFQLRQ